MPFDLYVFVRQGGQNLTNLFHDVQSERGQVRLARFEQDLTQ